MTRKKSDENGMTHNQPDRPICGIVMPISAIDGLSSEHWADVLQILKDVIRTAGFEPNLVSAADDIGVIQKRIIHNLYNNDVIVCDVSGKNPNVMFELGMRLAFDKAAIIIKDDQTDYSFDTSIIEHVPYPRDLRFTKILEFKEALKKKIEATYNASKQDPKFSTFLKNFGQYKVAHLEETEVSSNEYILTSLNELRNQIEKLGATTLVIPKRASRKEILQNYVNEYMNNHRVIDNFEAYFDRLYAHFTTDATIRSMYPNPSELQKDLDEAVAPF